MKQPMASELIQLAVGALDVVERGHARETPPMPGHPDWTVLPADAPLEAASAARAGAPRAIEGTLRKR